MTGKTDLIDILKKAKVTIKAIKNAKQANGKPYANNTIKGTFQSCLFLIDRLHLNINKNDFIKEFDISKIQSNDDNEQKADNVDIYKMNAYIQKVKDIFGDKSKMYVISKLYDNLPVRDDFQLKIVETPQEMTDGKINYIIIGKNKIIRVVINQHKTAKKYGAIDEKLTSDVSNIIREYVTSNGLKKGDYLFGDKTLTKFIHDNHKKIGVNGSISEIRHMKITQEMDTIKGNPEKRLKLADLMRHSPVTQLKYVRKHFKE